MGEDSWGSLIIDVGGGEPKVSGFAQENSRPRAPRNGQSRTPGHCRVLRERRARFYCHIPGHQRQALQPHRD
jgi:hypothetical protein